MESGCERSIGWALASTADEIRLPAHEGEVVRKGLKANALGLGSSTAIGMASTAPAYSLAATLGFVVAIIGVQTPLIVVLAFIPMFFSAWANKEMNRVDPDCGTSFTWAARALGPRTGWFAGGWGTIAADLLAMASQAQIAGQYLFLFFGINSIGQDPTSPWVLLTGIAWIVVLTWVCYVGIQVSARLQVALIVIEVVMLAVLSVVALVKVGAGTAPAGYLTPSWSWFDPSKLGSFSVFMQGMLLMVFIYWGWDTTVSINEETDEPSRIPGTAGVISTFLLLGTYLLVTISVQAFAGIGTHGIGLGNPNNQGDVLSVLGGAVFGHGSLGSVLSRLLILMVLSSSAATTQTTILPNARTTLSMAFHKAIPDAFGRTHPRYMTPTVSTVVFSAVSIVFYAGINFVSGGNVIADSVTAATFFVALYLGITGVACVWYFRHRMFQGARKLLEEGVLPGLSAVILFGLLIYSIYFYFDPSQSYVEVRLPIINVEVGGVMLIGVVTALLGLVLMVACEITRPAFFRDKSLRYGPSLTDSGQVVEIDEPPTPVR